MDTTTERLFDTVLSLPDGDRVELVEALIASLRPDDRPPLADAWRAIIQRRSAELKSGRVTPIPWAEVKRAAREKSRGPPHGGLCGQARSDRGVSVSG